ncbi:MAG: anhydro-N-acetylmuramic acid kinase [Rhodovibrionaceae bacterium]|nr:anhydro-N-acetylmuramic acid kinase [Rhodovibrionaceae bacterium]
MWALGLMSGTSLDGIDAALILTDGERVFDFGPAATWPYDEAMRARLRGVLGGKGPVAQVERELTELHAKAVAELIGSSGLAAADVRVVGFHGHTILHAPEENRTWQIGEGALLAKAAGVDVVADFRSRDVAEGGEGAPFAPFYHRALAAGLPRPLAVLNLGGVGNVTWIGEDDGLLAFDTGPGNALIDDWTMRTTAQPHDEGGALAARGTVDSAALTKLLDNPYFDRRPPKSLDRDAFDPAPVANLSAADGAATLTAFTAASVKRALAHLPAPPQRWLITGGGRHNPTLMRGLADALQAPVDPVEAVGWRGDFLEAEAFAFLAVRSLSGLALSVPGTTGVRKAVTGGRLFPASGARRAG